MIVLGRRRKANGTTEVKVVCPLCAGKAEINPGLDLWHCWNCGGGGHVPEAWLETVPQDRLEGVRRGLTEKFSRREFSDLPDFCRLEIERRGLSPEWIEREYGVVWDGERMAWPAGRGWSRRSPFPWVTPKTLTVAPKGLIGQHRLYPGASVVVVEGDYKAAAIPHPWVGVGLMGTVLSLEQMATLKGSRPASVTICLDHGYLKEAGEVRRKLLPLDVRVVEPAHGGPDDIPRAELYQLLIGGER